MSPQTYRIMGTVGGFLLLIGGGILFIWLKISTIKDRLEEVLGKSLGAQVEVASLHVDAWNGRIEASGISLINQHAESPWDTGKIGQAVATYQWSDLLRSAIPLKVEISGWKVGLHSPSSGGAQISKESAVTQSNSITPRSGIRVTQISARGR